VLIKNNINKDKANEVLSLTSRILRIAYIVALILGVYVITLILKEWGILVFIFRILKTLSPLFLGILIAWLLDPLVSYLSKKGMRRGIASVLAYLLFLMIIYLIISTMVPMITEQINDFVGTLPNIINTVKDWIDNLFSNLNNNSTYNFTATKLEIFASIEDIGRSITENLPDFFVGVVKGLFSTVGTVSIALIIGFYMLFDFNNISKKFIEILPKKYRDDGSELLTEINTSLRGYVQGVLIDAFVVFLTTSIAFWIIGLKAPLLFGLICGITNIIPYVGPYLGGAPAALVGFTQSTATGIIIIVALCIIQFIDGNIFNPFIMKKAMKLHPVTIIIGLLIFGSLFGILGMILATPLIAIGKLLLIFFDEKYNIFKWVELKRR
jgi:predicted PurR-regulated permease PerM